MKLSYKLILTAFCLLTINLSSARADISFKDVTAGSATFFEAIAGDGSDKVFIFKGLADGDTSTIRFDTNSDCPFVAVTGGAKFNSAFTCADGIITADVTYKGGLSFGPATESNADSFYINFSSSAGSEGMQSPDELRGIQFSLYGDISKWDMTGSMSASGTSFGLEISGPQGKEIHFLMELPSAAVTYLGGILGMTVGGKPDPFASVETKEDGSVAIAVDITNLQATSVRTALLNTRASKTIKKKYLAGKRKISIASKKSSYKVGATASLAMCAGASFTAGDKATVTHTLNGKVSSSFRTSKVTLDENGCAKKTLKLPRGKLGTLVSKITYKKQSGTGSFKITK